jgi:hypothetical protein
MGNLLNPRLLNTQDENRNTQYSASLALVYGSVAPSQQSLNGGAFQGNSDLFQIQSLVFGIQPVPIRNIQGGFTFDSNGGGSQGSLYIFMPDTGELIAIDQQDATAYTNGCVSFCINILPSFQIQFIKAENHAGNMTGNGIFVLSTFGRHVYWS